MMKKLLFLVACLLLTGYSCNSERSASNPQVEQLETWEISNCHDGDTCTLVSGAKKFKVRFACTDSREIQQPGGTEDRDYLRSLLSNGGNQVKVDPVKQDRYGRTVAEQWVNQGQEWESVQKLMIASGHGFAYEQYKEDCKNWDVVQKAEEEAKRKRLGVWAVSNPERPWDWRRQNR